MSVTTLLLQRMKIFQFKLKATVVYRCLEFKNRSRKNKSGLKTQTEGNTSNIRGEQRHNRNTKMQHTQKRTIE